jgi:outer membrane protein assembly factor BamD (BamD/ComL family)
MMFDRVVFIVLLTLLMSIAGCAGRMPVFLAFSEQERSLNEALDKLGTGNEQQARDLLEKVVNGVPSSGITDEALFRLALLNLKHDGGKGIQRAQALLERLADKYPESIWTRQSAPLLNHLEEARVLRNRQRELKTLKEKNYSLDRDNKEMRQSLEQLKQLDLELEQKIKR